MEPSPSTIGLIGGRGQMGRMFRSLFENQGYRVLVAGRKTELTYEALVAQADVVIVTVPIAQTEETIRRIAPAFRPGQLFSDFTSVKRGPVAAMLESPAAVIGCHPIFGPMADLSGQNVVLCPARPGSWLEWYRGVFESGAMKVREMTPEAHDDAMAVIQGLTHFIQITFAETLRARNVPLEDVLDICSPVYRVFFAMMCRVLSGDSALYAEIQGMNDRSPPVIADFLDSGADLLKIVRGGDLRKFETRFREAAEFLGPYGATAREESDYLVEMMRRYAPQPAAGPAEPVES